MAKFGRVRSSTLQVVLALLALVSLVDVADAKITIRRHAPVDSFFFHGNYSSVPFDPSQAFALEIWNCANGAMPQFIADREPLIICSHDEATGYTFADLVYVVEVPAGTCIDHGRSCYYRRSDGSAAVEDVHFFRVRYARRGHGNRVWLDSTGDLSAATQARMLILIKNDGRPRALLEDTFTPLSNGGWFSSF